MEILLENLIKTVVIIGLALALGGLKYTLVAILSFAILRFFTFGLHCQSGVMCLLLSVFLDVISPILIKDIYVGTIARSVLLLLQYCTNDYIYLYHFQIRTSRYRKSSFGKERGQKTAKKPSCNRKHYLLSFSYICKANVVCQYIDAYGDLRCYKYLARIV